MRRSMRVYIVTHHDGRVTGHLMRTWSSFFDQPPPAAYGESVEDVLVQLEVILQEAIEAAGDTLDRYLWEETFRTRHVTVEVHPQTALENRYVIGKQRVPLKLTYSCCKLEGGGWRVMLPRFGWWFVVEDLDMAADVLRHAVSSALLGGDARWLYEFRAEGEEFVHEWMPTFPPRKTSSTQGRYDTTRFKTMNSIGEEWVERAQERKLPRPMGSLDWKPIEPVVRRSPPLSILLVGSSGVGKTTWVKQLAFLLAAQRRNESDGSSWAIPRVWATSADRIIAGMKYLGQWEERCLEIVRELSFEGDYLFVGSMVELMRERGGHSSIADMFAPAVARGELSLISEVDEHELERCVRANPGFVNLFKIIRVSEPPAEQLPQLFSAYMTRLRPEIVLQSQALRLLVRMLGFFERDVAFPGKGFKFLDWFSRHVGENSESRVSRSVDMEAMIQAYSEYLGLPTMLLSDAELASSGAISDELSRHIIGQDRACGVAARVLARFKAGMNDPEKPCGSLFFVGPTGVGKTELAKRLSQMMFGSAERMIRVDMSEYMLPGASQRLLHVGGGARSLAEQVRRQPLSLILFDEIEKAHPEVFDLLLGVLGEGRLTDSSGKLIDFRMAMIVMTSNLGVQRTASPGFGGHTPDFTSAVRKHFRPEFFNRIDDVVPFEYLTPEDVAAIAEIELGKVSRRAGITRRNLALRVDDAARAKLAELGWHPEWGARPLKRIIEEKVMTPLAIEMARSPHLRDKDVVVTCDDAGEVVVLT